MAAANNIKNSTSTMRWCFLIKIYKSKTYHMLDYNNIHYGFPFCDTFFVFHCPVSCLLFGSTVICLFACLFVCLLACIHCYISGARSLSAIHWHCTVYEFTKSVSASYGSTQLSHHFQLGYRSYSSTICHHHIQFR